MKKYQSIARLEKIMEDLRHPQHGCPWDLEQDFQSLTSYSIEEVYELIEAIDQNDSEQIKKELGDIFFHLMFYAQLAKEKGWFDLDDIAETISNKMIQRHPHVFDNKTENKSDKEKLKEDWYQQKEKEKEKQNTNPEESRIKQVSSALPAFTRAKKLQQQASRVEFDWQQAEQIIDKLKEEVNELEQALNEGKQAQQEELGDILFTCVNLSRHLNIDAETSLRKSNNKFVKRFHELEKTYSYDYKKMEGASIEELEQLWSKIKHRK